MSVNFPEILITQFAVLFDELETGIILNKDFEWNVGQSECFYVFDSLEEAERFSLKIIKEKPNLESTIYSYDQYIVKTIKGEKITSHFPIVKKIGCAVLCIFILFLGGYFLFTFLYNGPDSRYSKKGFIRHVGFPPPPSVSKIYYESDDLWLDPTYRLRFMCSDPGVVEQFISFQQLQECKEPVLGLNGDDPKWWKEKDMKSNLKCFTREIPQNFWHLWYDPVTGTVWYEEYST